MASTPFVTAALTGQATGIDLSAYVAQTGDLNAVFAKSSDSGASGSVIYSSSGHFKVVSTNGTQDEKYLASTQPSQAQIDVSMDVYFGTAGINSNGEVLGVTVGDDGTANNALHAYVFNSSASGAAGLNITLEAIVAGANTKPISGVNVSGQASTSYTLSLSIRGPAGSQTATITWGPKGGTQSVVGTAAVAIPAGITILGRSVGIRAAQIATANSDTLGLFPVNFAATNYTSTAALAAGTISSVVAGSAAGAATVNGATPTGGTSPYSIQFQRAPDASGSPGTFVNDGTAGTGLNVSDTGLTAGATYWYREVVTDSASTPATSTGASRSYTVPTAGFSIATAPASLALVQGQALTLAVTAQAVGGYSGTDTLSCTGLPSGVTAAFSPTTLTNGAGSSTLTLTAAGNAAVGLGTIGVQATDGTLTSNAPVLLQVGPPTGLTPTSSVADTDYVPLFDATGALAKIVTAATWKAYLASGGS